MKTTATASNSCPDALQPGAQVERFRPGWFGGFSRLKENEIIMAHKKTAGGGRTIGMIGLVWCATVGAARAADSLCAPTEEVFFNCRIKDSPKLLSVCGRAGAEARRGAALPGDYLQYRFGPRDKPELIFPKVRKG
jgi:hypothetical protein